MTNEERKTEAEIMAEAMLIAMRKVEQERRAYNIIVNALPNAMKASALMNAQYEAEGEG